MSDVNVETSGRKPRTLVFSLRNIFGSDLFRCPHFEFEDIITQIDDAEIFAPKADPNSRRNQIANWVAFHGPARFRAEIEKKKVNGSWDLFFAICGHPRDLIYLDAAHEWQSACTVKVCMMDEIWIKQMEPHRHFIDILRKFDLVVLYYSQSVQKLEERIGVKSVFLPPGIDCTMFSPLPNPPQRSIDVYSVGRRSEKTHKATLEMAEKRGSLYLHDSIAGLRAIDTKEHRRLFANIAKRSRYFIVNPGLIDRPDRRGDQIEIGNRYFEGAAAGMILVGEKPANGQFGRLFDWPGALIHLPWNSEKIAEVIEEFERDPELGDATRATNMAQALTRHDWNYRWEEILRHVGIPPLPALSRRKERLHAMAESLHNSSLLV